MFGKDLNRRVIRSARPQARQLSHAKGILNLFKLEYFVVMQGEAEARFFIAHVIANHMEEATHMLRVHASRRKARLTDVHRKYDLGKDHSWKHGNLDYKPKIAEVRMFCFETHERLRKELTVQHIC